MKNIAGKVFFGIAVIGALMISICLNFYTDMHILLWAGIPAVITGVIGTCVFLKTLRKYLVDLLDLI